ncbi:MULTISPECIES: DUF3873 family protein [Muribaculaceae]|uniref:DUF3873 family protein n=1 Tax=Muribaculaceae TaxID=2005473 RepID=UPI00262AB043|nr:MULTISPECIES: DUF3873 family protein [Muribaculaceae]
MATRMTRNGVSTTASGEQYEKFYSSHRGKRVTRIMYDWRDPDTNELFSCVAPNLKECRKKRDEWIARQRKN